MISHKIRQQINDHDVISFDLFGTLVLRPFLHPYDLWEYIEKKHKIPKFFQCRKKSNVTLYSSIDDQYEMMPQNMQNAKHVECQLEVDLSIVNSYAKTLYDLAKKLKKTIVISSDMYLPYDVIEKILTKHGIMYDKLYVSNCIKASKFDGTMFEKIKDDYKGLRIMHIGDNQRNDIQMAALHGIDSLYVEDVYQHMLSSNNFMLQFLSKHNSLKNRIFVACLATSVFNYQSSLLKDSYWSRVDEIIGTTITVLFMQFIFRYVKYHNIKHIMFIGRDGYILKSIFDALDDGNVDSYYVYSPRNLEKSSVSQQDEFSTYIKSFGIKEQCVIVDLTTQDFTAQKNISNALQHEVDEIAFISPECTNKQMLVMTAPKEFLWICMLVECLFRSPEFPISSIKDNEPIYSYDVNMFELFFTETANLMLYIQQKCAIPVYNMLDKMGIQIDGQEYLDFLLLFMMNLTSYEKTFFKTFKHIDDGQLVHIAPPEVLNIK